MADETKPDPVVIKEQSKALIRGALLLALGAAIGKHVAPEPLYNLADSVAGVVVTYGGIGVTVAWSLLNKWFLVTKVADAKQQVVETKMAARAQGVVLTK